MSKEEINRINKLIEENLPDEINGFKRRIAVINNFSTIIYSKSGSFLTHHLRTNIIKDNEDTDLKDFASNVLYDVFGNNLEECYNKIKEKLDLNDKVKAEFSKNIMFGFIPSFKLQDGNHGDFLKLFEVYLVLDINSNSQFFCVVTINPSFDAIYIIPIINDLRKKIDERNFIKLSGEDFDYTDFDLPRLVHLYSYDFNQKKEEIKSFFRKHGWNTKLKDRYVFEKQKNLQQQKIILCEGKNYKLLNNIKIPGILFSEEHNSVSIFQNIKTREKYCLRDKDYLLDEEISRLKAVFPKYYILSYYSIENYLYHPDNIEELRPIGFSKNDYIEDIIKCKNDLFLEIVSDIKLIRKGYKELTENHIKEVVKANAILIDELKSNEFEVFYKHFNIKELYNKKFLEKFNLNEFKLANTNWFRNKMRTLLNKVS